jgi:hypothetical protein
MNPFDNNIRQCLSGFLTKYQIEFIWPSCDIFKHEEYMLEALESRDYRIVFWFMSKSYPTLDPFVVFDPVNSAKYGIISAVKWLFSEQTYEIHLRMSREAYKNRNYEVCKWLNANGLKFEHTIMEKIEKTNDVQMMSTIEWNIEECENASCYGRINCLKYAFDIDPNLDLQTCGRYAASNGKFECLKYLHEIGYVMDETTCSEACYALNDYGFECLKYAHDQGCPWDENTCINAAMRGNIECLVYAHENGCPWNRNLVNIAREYMFDFEMAEYTSDIMLCIQYATENGCAEMSDE